MMSKNRQIYFKKRLAARLTINAMDDTMIDRGHVYEKEEFFSEKICYFCIALAIAILGTGRGVYLNLS